MGCAPSRPAAVPVSARASVSARGQNTADPSASGTAAAAALPPAPAAPGAVGLAQRLVQLGRSASLELSPAQVMCRNLKYTLVGALDEAAAAGTPPPLLQGTHCFINMVKKTEGHFAEVGAAAAALLERGMVPVPHLPASRFDSAAQLQETLELLSNAVSAHCCYAVLSPRHNIITGGVSLRDCVCSQGCDRLLLLGGNDQHERGLGGSAFK